MGKYDDIINLPHHVSPTRKPMSMENRAAQFAPFAALTGHSEAINETSRFTSEKIELSPEEQEAIAAKIVGAINNPSQQHRLSITVFRPDMTKDGGEYIHIVGAIKNYNDCARTITLTDNQIILIDNIVAVFYVTPFYNVSR